MAGTYFGADGVIPGTTGNLDPTSAAKPAGSAGVAVGSGTGRFGVIPIVSDLGGGVKTAYAEFWDWLTRPFGPASPANLVIGVGVVIVAWLAWTLILYHVRIAAESI